MTRDGSDRRKPDHRAFRPTLDGTLEPRLLMAAKANIASPLSGSRTASGGQAVVVTLASKERFYISIVGGGTVRATPANGGRINLIIDGSSVDSLLTINPIIQTPTVQSTGGSSGETTRQVLDAHTFRTALQNQNRLLNVASIRVTSGTIGAIEGYRDTILSGPVTVSSTNRVDRIAFAQINRRGSITVGGDLNTLDVLLDADFNTGAGLNVGRDLNLLNVGGNLTFRNGAKANVGRYLGLNPQAAKGSGTGGFGASIQGNATIEPGSSFNVVGGYVGPFIANGTIDGASRFLLDGVPVLNTSSANQLRGLGGGTL